MTELRECSAFLWHIGHGVAADMLMGRQVLNAAETMGLVVFPNRATSWHFDDKVAQKYLLESIGAPLVPTYTFFELKSALEWINGATFPKVFKLRRGSGSRNVCLVRSREEASRLARRAFLLGFKPSGSLLGSVTAWKVQKAKREGQLLSFVQALPSKIRHRLKLDFLMGREKGYVYFQEFLANNEFDTRVTVIGNRAFAFRRRVRANDFRASGSGQIVYDRAAINLQCVQMAFNVSQRLGAQSMAFDFIQDAEGQPRIVEVSYGYDSRPVYEVGGFWDPELVWHEGGVWPEFAIIEDVLGAVTLRGE